MGSDVNGDRSRDDLPRRLPAALGQRGPSDRYVGELALDAADRLRELVTLARDDDDVPVTGLGHGATNRPRSVEIDRSQAGFGHRLEDGGGDVFRIFVARVVARDDDAIRDSGRGAHGRPLVLVSVATRAEHDHDASFAERTRRVERAAKGVRRVRVIDYYRGLAREDLEATTRGRCPGNRGERSARLRAESHGEQPGGERILQKNRADGPGAELDRASAEGRP